jgi:hypothetical protein
MSKDTFVNRVITLTSQKITLESDYRDMKERFGNDNLSQSGKTRLKKNLRDITFSLDHCESNIKLNKYLSKD